MRGVLTVLGIVLASLVSTEAAQAGLYTSLETSAAGPPEIPANQIKFIIGELRGLRLPLPPGTPPAEPGTRRFLYQSQLDRLERQQADGLLTPAEQADLAACYMRFGRPQDAIRLLSRANKDHFLIQANLAAAYFEQDNLELAIRHQQRLLEIYPTVWAGWTPAALVWNRQCDRAFLKLMQSRQEEQRRRERERLASKVDPGPVPLDPIFPGVRFVGPDHKTYEPGTLAPDMFDRLPANAVGLVLQFLVWKPADDRLGMLLAELLNAAGYIDLAEQLMPDPFLTGLKLQDLIEHRRVLKEALDAAKLLGQPDTSLVMLAMFAPPPLLAPPGVGPLALEAGFSASPTVIPPLLKKSPGLPPESAPPSPSGISFDWRHVTVGFLTGCVVAVLVGLQWQEWRRRRALSPPVEEPMQTPDRVK
jgi:tetratricopeptide (TPR) repeat protein